jgi:hypothetical protein
MDTVTIREYDVANWQDEARVDRLCQSVLRQFHSTLLNEQQCDPIEAGLLARSADYFLREFIVGDRQENIFEILPIRVHQFAGNWYIIKNMEPNMEELTDLMFGIDSFYSWAADSGLYKEQDQMEIRNFCRALDVYRERIESFWEISDNYADWDSEIPLKD